MIFSTIFLGIFIIIILIFPLFFTSIINNYTQKVLQPSIISTVLDWKDQSIYAPSSTSNSGVQRVVACAPIATRKGSSTKKDNKSMGWMPIFNNDKGEEKIWKDFIEAYKLHPKYIGYVLSKLPYLQVNK